MSQCQRSQVRSLGRLGGPERPSGRRAEMAVALLVVALLALLPTAAGAAPGDLTLTVTVVDPAGVPLADVGVVATEAGGPPFTVTGATGADGTTSLDVPPGTVALALQPTSGSPRPVTTVTGGVDEEVAVSLEAPTVSAVAVARRFEALLVTWAVVQDHVGWPAVSGQRVLVEPGGIDVLVGAAATSLPLSGLDPTTAYTVRVVPLHSGFVGVPSAPSAPTHPYGAADLPAAPTDVTATLTGTTATVTWTPPVAPPVPVAGYTVRSSEGDVVPVGSAAVAATVPDLTPGSAATFTVQAFNAAGVGPESVASPPAAVPTVPAAPTGLSATMAGTTAQLSWTPSAADGGAPVTLQVLTVHPAGTEVVLPSTATTRDVAGLASGTTVSFTVTAVNAVGRSVPSTSTPDLVVPTVPSEPTGAQATVSGTTATVTWTAPATDGGSPIRYHLITVVPGGAEVLAGAGATSGQVAGLPPGSQVAFSVQAVNAVGRSAPSEPTAVLDVPTVPTVPTGVTVASPGTTATVAWSAPASDGGSPVMAQVVTMLPEGEIRLPGPTATTVDFGGLVPGSEHTFTVVAINAVGSSPVATSAPLLVPTVAAAPTGVAVSSPGTTATVSWVLSADDGGTPVIGQIVTVQPDGVEVLVGPTATSVPIPGLTPGGQYHVTVLAVNAVGRGPASEVVDLDVPTVAEAATAVTASATGTAATVIWAAPGDDGGTPIVGYTITAVPDGPTAQTGPMATEATLTGLTPGGRYTFEVRAVNAVGTGAPGASEAVDVPTAPTAPIDLVLTVVGTTLEVAWTPPASDGGAPLLGYDVDVVPGSGPIRVGPGAVWASFPGLVPLETYHVTVVALNAVGLGTPSAEAGPVVIPTVPVAPTGVTADDIGTAALVSWTAPIDDGGSPLTAFDIAIHPGTRVDQVGPAATQSLVTGLAPGGTFTFTVTARNLVGPGAPSVASLPLGIGTVPVAPTNVEAVAVGINGLVSWVPAAYDGGSPLNAYLVTAHPAEVSTLVGPNATTATVSDLPYGSTQTYTVQARNLVGDGPGSASAPIFMGWSDVPVGHPFVTDIAWMASRSLAGGFPDGTYQPGRVVTRQALAAFLYRMAGSPLGPDPQCTTNAFRDVVKDNPFCGEILWAQGVGIVNGYGDDTFRPDAKISRQAVATMLWRAAGQPAVPPGAATFTDVGPSHPFHDAIGWMAANDITKGYADGGFHPTDAVSRQAMAAFLHRFDALGLDVG